MRLPKREIVSFINFFNLRGGGYRLNGKLGGRKTHRITVETLELYKHVYCSFEEQKTSTSLANFAIVLLVTPI